MGINYRSEPLRERLNGDNDPAYVFSSLVHGDPATPILETYPGDPMVIRLLDGSHEEQHAFNIAGLSWKKEITDEYSPIVQEQTIGVSEAFNFRVDDYYSAGDYLYYFGGIDDIWLGLWGIIRAYDKEHKDLIPLSKAPKFPQPKPLEPPKDAVIRKYEVAAIQKDIQYNKHGDHDPDGLIFVSLSEVEDVLKGHKKPKPLILRANAGEWIEVTLYNMFDYKKLIPYYEYPSVPVDKKHKPSYRVSLHPQFLKYDAIKSSGINVGLNSIEQTVKPGESIKYLWHADKEYGACIINSFGDLRNHRYHGLFGAIIIEPAGAKYYDDNSHVRDSHDEAAVIIAPGVETYREFVLFVQNGIRLLDKHGNIVKTAQDDDGIDHEDTGEKGYNYRSERFYHRLKKHPIHKVFDSKAHGDPATPVFKTYTGERVIFRVLMPCDKPRNVGFLLHGHQWRAQPDDPFSRIISSQGAISVGSVYNIELLGGANKYPGDYLYRSGSLRWDVESGMWGIFRVNSKGVFDKIKKTFKKIINFLF